MSYWVGSSIELAPHCRHCGTVQTSDGQPEMDSASSPRHSAEDSHWCLDDAACEARAEEARHMIADATEAQFKLEAAKAERREREVMMLEDRECDPRETEATRRRGREAELACWAVAAVAIAAIFAQPFMSTEFE